MKLQEVILRAIAKKITWVEAAEIAAERLLQAMPGIRGSARTGSTSSSEASTESASPIAG